MADSGSIPGPAAEQSADEITPGPAGEHRPAGSGADEPPAQAQEHWEPGRSTRGVADGPPTVSWQLSVDAGDPHTLADFWVAALGYQIEDNTTMIDGLIAQGHVPEAATVVRPDGIRSFAEFEAIRGDGRRILFHAVPESKQVKNRWHIDLNVGKENLAAESDRLVALGASQLGEVEEPGGHFIVMQDPEGNEFCIQ